MVLELTRSGSKMIRSGRLPAQGLVRWTSQSREGVASKVETGAYAPRELRPIAAEPMALQVSEAAGVGLEGQHLHHAQRTHIIRAYSSVLHAVNRGHADKRARARE